MPTTAPLAIPCSNCGAALIKAAWLPNTKSPITRIIATCPYCGDASFPVDVGGGLLVVPYGEAKEDDIEDVISTVAIAETDYSPPLMTYKLIKTEPNAKPIRRI